MHYPHSRTLPLLAVATFLAAVLLFPTQPLRAQSGHAASSTRALLLEGKTILHEATNKGSVDSLMQARALFKRATGRAEHQPLAHYYAALADYRLNNQLGEDEERKREQMLGDATKHLEQATELDADLADAWALLTGIYGQRMGLNPMQAMSLGSDADEAMKHARELAPKNPRVWIISGTQDFFTPGMFGGDKERALKKFNKAARLAEQETVDDPLMPSWGHAEAYAWIGIAHLEVERYAQARTAFENALNVNPEYGWVKHVLLPRAKQQAE